jgi:hypothetical protein
VKRIRFRRVVRRIKRASRAFARLPKPAKLVIGFVLAAALCFGCNWLYQVARKPTELFFPVSGTLNKTPTETWRQYGPLFERYSTALIDPELLAALAQVEGSGNPLAQTYWRWAWRGRPFDVYRPASSAVGMYQITDGTFELARHYCIRGHRVVAEGPWNDWDSCWFNVFYMRVLPAHAVELTSAYLDRAAAAALARARLRSASTAKIAELAAVIHLCGAGAGEAFALRGLRFTPDQRCGDQEAQAYVARVTANRRLFAALARGDGSAAR